MTLKPAVASGYSMNNLCFYQRIEDDYIRCIKKIWHFCYYPAYPSIRHTYKDWGRTILTSAKEEELVTTMQLPQEIKFGLTKKIVIVAISDYLN